MEVSIDLVAKTLAQKERKFFFYMHFEIDKDNNDQNMIYYFLTETPYNLGL